MVSGSTGASGERDWTTKIVPMVTDRLRNFSQEVYTTDAFAYNDEKVTSTDWDLFLAVHYDADIYNDRGGFADYPDQSADKVWERSKQLSDKIEEVFFSKTGIPVKNNRSNANTKFYYMWKSLTENTPCVLIECGVGNRKPEDYETLRKYDFIADSLTQAILEALGVSTDFTIFKLEEKIDQLNQELIEMRESRNKWKRMYASLEETTAKEYQLLSEQVKNLQSELAEVNYKVELMTSTIEKTSLENESLREACRKIDEKYLDLSTNSQSIITNLNKELDATEEKCQKLTEEIEQFKLLLSQEIKKLSLWQILVALFSK